MNLGDMKKYCYTDKKREVHCHVFDENNIYNHFETNGMISYDYSPMVEGWIKDKRTENDLRKSLEQASFLKT